jgi:hypothetical protein
MTLPLVAAIIRVAAWAVALPSAATCGYISLRVERIERRLE